MRSFPLPDYKFARFICREWFFLDPSGLGSQL